MDTLQEPLNLQPYRNLRTFAKYLNKFGIISGSKIFLSNFFGKKQMKSIHIPGLPDKIFLRNHTSDADCFQQVFVDLNYDFEINFNPRFIIDCGANVGFSSLFFHKKFKDALVVAVEPELSNYTMLCKNTAPYKQIQCLNKGIWNKNINLEITTEAFHKWGCRVRETEKESEDTIGAVTIGSIMKQFGYNEIDILKIDIEGSELEVFSENYEEWLPKTKIIMIELHDWTRKNCSKAFFKTLFQYDFSINQYHKGEIIMCIRNN